MGAQSEQFYRTLGATIRRRRDALELTQAALGARLNPPMTRASIANIEAGKQRVLAHTLVDIASALTLKLDDLVASTDVGAAELVEELRRASGIDERTAAALTEKILAHGKRRRPT